MFDLFRRARPVTENTFKARVDRFWKWFASNSEAMLSAIDDKRCGDLQDDVSRQVDGLGPGFGWVFGPGENGARHSFTLTGEGVVERQILAQYWQSRSPQLPGWSIYGSRQPSRETPTWELHIDEDSFKPAAFWCSVFLDEQDEEFDITVWHPLFAKLPKEEHFRVLFIVLDELLGEFGTQRWIGEIKISKERLAESMPVAELRDYVNAETARRGWKLIPPGEKWSLFRFESAEDFPRGDVLTWNTAVPALVHETFDSKGSPSDLLEGTGAEFLFVKLPAEVFPRGREVETRGEVEDALDTALKGEASGMVVGGSLGPSGGYIDLLALDGSNSVNTIQRVTGKLSLAKGTALYRHHEPRGHPIFQ